jgi:hypothetical protein
LAPHWYPSAQFAADAPIEAAYAWQALSAVVALYVFSAKQL